jgi:hypothetical protein
MSRSCNCLVVLFTLAAIQVACEDDDQPSLNVLDGGGGTVPDASGGVSPDVASPVGSADAAAPADAAAEPAPTFTQVYTTVIQQRCMPCHTTATGIGVSQGHLDMSTKAAAFMNLVNVPATGVECTGKGTRIVPGMEEQSILYLKVALDHPTPCGAKMPLGLPALPETEVDMIEDWIRAGAKND